MMGNQLGRNRPPAERASVRLMAGYIRPHLPALLCGGLLSLATGATGLVLPLVVRDLIADLSRHQGLARPITIMCVLMLADTVLGSAGGYLLLRVADTVVLTTRKSLAGRLLRITVGAFDASEPGDLMARATVDTTLLRGVVSTAIVPAVTGLLTGLGAVVLMGLVDDVLLGVTAAVLATIVALQVIVLPKIGRATRETQRAVGEIAAALERTFGAFRTVKASGAEAREAARIQDASIAAWQAGLRADFWQAVVGNTAALAAQFAFLAVLATGAAQVAAGTITVGTLVAFLMYILFLIGPIQQVVSAAIQYQAGAAAVTRIEEARNLPAEPSEEAERAQATMSGGASGPGKATMLGAATMPAEATVPGAASGPASVEFADVRFSYSATAPQVHHGVSFAIPGGGMTAFVGPSGAGKTTVFSLIERFYEPDSGTVLVDGTDVRRWPLARLRAAIGYVEQDAPVLSGTLWENLTFGAPRRTREQVAEVLRVTRLQELTRRSPDGLETFVGHRGMRLSGGERQRVAIARALLRRPRLLLLDEATSQLDAINEAALRDTVAEVSRQMTVLVVAHRLSTVMMADAIIVMDGGLVQASGTHAELVAASPLYTELAATQFLTASAGARDHA
jgi:ABC-type multidrug transport system fused ATPase/permease subunit